MATISADLGGKNYVLGRGRVSFDRFAPNAVVTAATFGEGERYLGNTPSFTTSGTSEDLDHYSSEGGVKVKDDSVQLQLDREGKFEADHIDQQNLALYFLGVASSVAQSAATAVTQQFTVKQGRFYQLGQSASLPSGHRLVTITAVGKGAGFSTPVTGDTNFQYDTDTGRMYIPEGAPDLPDDTLIQVTYDVGAASYNQVISSTSTIYGALRFVSDNPKGTNRDYYFPYVKISPDGDYELKGDDWQKMSFTFEILKKASNVEAVYVTTRPVAA